MQTSPLMNPANLVQSLTATARPSENSAPDASFNQVFSRELADRQSQSQRDASKASSTQNAAQAPQQPAAAANSKAPDAGNAGEAQEQTQDDTTTAPDAASTEMLALVQANVVPLDPRGLAALAPEAGAVRDTLRALTPADLKLADGVDAKGLSVKADADDFATIALQEKTLAAGKAEALESTVKTAPVITDLASKLAVASQKKAEPAAPESSAKANIEPVAGMSKELTALATVATTAKAEAPAAKDSGVKPADLPPAPAVSNDIKPAAELAAAAKSASQAAAPVQAAPELVVTKAPEAPTVAMLSAMQHAAPAQAQAMGGPASDRLTPKVGTPGWDNALGQKLSWMVSGGVQSATLNLNPPDLGPMQVVLNVSNSQATASFTAAQPEVRQAIENAMPKLREMMAETGIQLGQTSVSTGMPNQNQYGGAGEQPHPHSRHFSQAAALAEKAPVIARPVTSGSGQGMIDTFA